jgi:hypothetical protein
MATDGTVKARVASQLQSYPGGGHIRLGALLFMTTGALVASHRAEAAWGEATGDPGHFGVVLEGAGEWGGDDLVKVFFRDGGSQTIRAGQGFTVAGGVHYRPEGLPVDFTATVGYKFVRTDAYNTDLGVDRVVLKFTGTVPVGNHFWLMAGPVWHTAVKLNGDGFVPDINFDDAVGGTAGFGWRWIGVSYTYIKYSGPYVGSVNANSGGITFAWKF